MRKECDIVHTNFDSGSRDHNETASFPGDSISAITFTHDGGRISIQINGEEVFKTNTGTRDCEIQINVK